MSRHPLYIEVKFVSEKTFADTMSLISSQDVHSSLLYFVSVLPELPLPTPLQNALNNKSLLYSLNLSEESRRLLDDADDALVEDVSNLLRQGTTENM